MQVAWKTLFATYARIPAWRWAALINQILIGVSHTRQTLYPFALCVLMFSRYRIILKEVVEVIYGIHVRDISEGVSERENGTIRDPELGNERKVDFIGKRVRRERGHIDWQNIDRLRIIIY